MKAGVLSTIGVLLALLVCGAEPEPAAKAGRFHLGSNRRSITVALSHPGQHLQLRFVSLRPAPGVVTVYTPDGRIALTCQVMFEAGKNSVPVPGFIDLPEGQYRVRLITCNKFYDTWFLLWKSE